MGRLDSGVGGGSWSAAAGAVGVGGFVAFGVTAEFAGETEGVGAVLTKRGFGVVCT